MLKIIITAKPSGIFAVGALVGVCSVKIYQTILENRKLRKYYNQISSKIFENYNAILDKKIEEQQQQKKEGAKHE